MSYEYSMGDDTIPSTLHDARPPFITVNHYELPMLKQAGPSAALAYLYLLKCAGSKETCFPSHKNIAQETGLSVNTVKTSVAKLIEVGLVTLEHRFREEGGKTSNRYTVGLSKFDTPIAKICLSPQAKSGYEKDTSEKDIYTPSKSDRRKAVPDGWGPTPAGCEYAIEHGMDNREIGTQVEKFIVHHQSKGNVFASIDKAWQTWCLNFERWGKQNDPARTWSDRPVAEDTYTAEQYAKDLAAEEAYRREHPDPVQ